MKLQPIINQLFSNLPFATEKFSTVLSTSSVTRTGSTVTIVTTDPHLLSTNDFIVIVGAKSGVLIDVGSSTINADNSVTFVTSSVHNLTERFNFKTLLQTDPIVEIDGTDPFYNGENIFSKVPNKNTFIVQYTSTPPPISGTPTAYDGVERGYNGIQQITVTGANTFTYPITGMPENPFGTIKVHKDIRVSGALTNQRVEEMYTKQADGNFWLFVAESTDTMSKDRNVLSDAVTERYGGVAFRSRIIDNFGCYVAAPSSDFISGRFTHDELEDTKIALIKTLANFKAPDLFTENENFALNYIASEVFLYDTAKIIKEFTFQTQYDITINDAFVGQTFVSAKTMDYNFNNGMTADFNLNEDKT